ncbi:MAG: LLM class flavin-dependent oxidoreductase [Sandaracinus sp.]
MSAPFEIGLDTFGDRPTLPDGTLASHAQALREVVAQAVLADEVGLDFVGLGEHHRDDFAISAPEVVLGAIAARTQRIKVGTAVTILSTDDPIRVFQRFSTLHAISDGRAELMLGRGSFTESFPLFGHSLRDYEALFEEKLELFAAVRAQEPIRWRGSHRPPLELAAVYPPVERGLLPVWVGVGGTPESVVRAAHYGFGLMLAIIGGQPARFAPLVTLFHRALAELGRAPAAVGVHAPGHVAETDTKAREEVWPHFLAQRTRIGGERGWPPPTRAQFEAECSPEGALFVGSAETVAAKIVATARTLRLDRFDLKYANGAMPHEQLMKTIELVGTEVAPRVRDALAR